jgi:hypothetical protein
VGARVDLARELTMSEERIEGLAGYDDVMMKPLQRLPLELRLAGLAPEEVARALGGLPEDVLAEVRRKLRGGEPGR